MRISLATPPEEGNKVLRLLPLRQSSFADFGTVVENPSPTLTSISEALPGLEQQTSPAGPAGAVMLANQNTALKYADMTRLTNDYAQSPSQTVGKAVMNMFACFPRLPLIARSGEEEDGRSSLVSPIRVLERHPFTTQTFVPMGLAASDRSTRYLVIVAPTLPPSEDWPDRGPPDLQNIKAFGAHGGQAVTYAPGTWHAPMAVMGANRIDFVVLQFCNGVSEEDCQEVEVDEGLEVEVSLEAVQDLEPKANNENISQWFRAGLETAFVDISTRFPNRMSHIIAGRFMYPAGLTLVNYLHAMLQSVAHVGRDDLSR